MLYTYSIEKLTGLRGIIINNIESNEKRNRRSFQRVKESITNTQKSYY